MNYCTKCASYYQNPGTCNCYAPRTFGTWTCPCNTSGICNCIRSTPWTWTTTGPVTPNGTTFTTYNNSTCCMTNCGGKCGICKPSEPESPPSGE